MQFTTVFALIASLAIPALSAPASESIELIVPLVFDTMYDNASGSLSSTACSPLPFPTFGQVPSYPNIGGAFAVEGFNSTQCGSCWKLSYVRPTTGATVSTFITAVNSAPAGFVTSLEAMTELLGVPRSQIPANVQVAAAHVAGSFCHKEIHT